ncbi:MAG: hypothetical protein ACTSVM_05670, partial [Candidatus Ranarchaeia archaeon]
DNTRTRIFDGPILMNGQQILTPLRNNLETKLTFIGHFYNLKTEKSIKDVMRHLLNRVKTLSESPKKESPQ